MLRRSFPPLSHPVRQPHRPVDRRAWSSCSGCPSSPRHSPAGAQSTTTAPAGEPGAEEVEDTIVQGAVINRAGTRERSDDEPVEGVEITVAEEGGDEIETATTADEGAWSVVVPERRHATRSRSTPTPCPTTWASPTGRTR